MKPKPTTRPLIPQALAFAIALALAGPALAQDSEGDEFNLDDTPVVESDPEARAELTEVKSWIEFGLGNISDDSFRFGRYRGMEEQGAFAVLNFDWCQRADYQSDDPTVFRMSGQNLGLSNRALQVEYGRQGDYRLSFNYDQWPSFRSDSAQTPLQGVGGTALTLPSDWVGAQTTAGMTRLLPNLSPVDLQQERKRFGLGFDYILSRGWEIVSQARVEHKDGLKSVGAVIGNSGGNPRAIILPEPVDYETREAEIGLRYGDERKQFEARYLASFFDDGNTALRWDNPYTAINGWNAAAGFPTGDGQLALPPDNQFHQLSLSGGFDFASGLRASGDLAFGRMTQDEAFLPYTINPVLAASITQPLPRQSLDGRIDTTMANFRLNGRFGDRFHWNASAQYDDRDNQTPRSEYVYIGGDSNVQNVAATSSTRRFNEPYSYRKTALKLDGGYRLGNRTQFTASVEQSDTERTYSEVEQADENTIKLSARHQFADWLNASVRWSRADREGSTYHGSEPFLSGYAPGYTSTVPGGWENAPGLRKYFLADRTRDRAGVDVSFTPNEKWNVNLNASRVSDDYVESELGVRDADSTVVSVDLSFMPNSRWTHYAFFTRETMELNQYGASIRGATRVIDPTDPARQWHAFHDDGVNAKGAGIEWKAIEKKLDLGLDYSHFKTRNEIEMQVGSGLTAAPLPINHTRLSSFSVFAKYRVNPSWSMQLRWWKEHFNSSDFALDGIEANQLANVILLGEESPDYEVNVLSFAATYRF